MGCCKSIASLLFLSVLFALFSITTCAPTSSQSAENITITAPQGTSNHGNPKLLCIPSKWTDIATFFLANFVAPAATVKSVPGELALSAFWALILTPFFPASGVRKGLSAIYQRAVLADTPLKTAARARALCMVVRTPEWLPQTGDTVEVLDYMDPRQPEKDIMQKPDFVYQTTKERRLIDGDEWDWTRIDRASAKHSSRSEKVMITLVKLVFLKVLRRKVEEQKFSEIPALVVKNLSYASASASTDKEFRPSSSSIETMDHKKIYGVCQLPEGYALYIVPPGAQVDEHQCDGKAPCNSELSSNYNLPKALTAIFQTLYASATLYQVRGNQIQRYGCAAFGLTVAPYLVMSIVNLASTVLTPDYSAMYLVSSEAMEEAQRREGSRFEGVVGTIRGNSTPNESFEKVKLEVNDDGRIFMLRPDLESSPQVTTEVVLARRGPLLNPRTGKFRCDGLLTRLLYQIYSRPNQPFFLIPRSSELPLGVEQQTRQEASILAYASVAVGSIPLAIIGGLSHFKPGQSTFAQRVWTMLWLAFQICFGPFLKTGITDVRPLPALILYMVLPLGCFVVVGQMLMQYGTCIQL